MVHSLHSFKEDRRARQMFMVAFPTLLAFFLSILIVMKTQPAWALKADKEVDNRKMMGLAGGMAVLGFIIGCVLVYLEK